MALIKKILKGKKQSAEYILINEEVNRSKRFGFNFGILIVELSHAAPYGLSRLMPGRTIAFKVLRQNIRCYDKIIGPFIRRYYILLPQTNQEGVKVVEKRIDQIAKKNELGTVYIGKAVFPFDGKDVKSLVNKALGNKTGKS